MLAAQWDSTSRIWRCRCDQLFANESGVLARLSHHEFWSQPGGRVPWLKTTRPPTKQALASAHQELAAEQAVASSSAVPLQATAADSQEKQSEVMKATKAMTAPMKAKAMKAMKAKGPMKAQGKKAMKAMKSPMKATKTKKAMKALPVMKRPSKAMQAIKKPATAMKAVKVVRTDDDKKRDGDERSDDDKKNSEVPPAWAIGTFCYTDPQDGRAMCNVQQLENSWHVCTAGIDLQMSVQQMIRQLEGSGCSHKRYSAVAIAVCVQEDGDKPSDDDKKNDDDKPDDKQDDDQGKDDDKTRDDDQDDDMPSIPSDADQPPMGPYCFSCPDDFGTD
ncbi:unnamed protein product [Symbiodinium microadriaticum]|nr:unnamed protein product [Symbiodinium sp. KB8]CAE7846683.1 unnamed protein product [Symbiodinium microadriaticum]